MIGMADQHDLAAALVVDFGLAMHFGNEGAGCVQRKQITFLRLCGNRLWHAVSRKNDRRIGVRNLIELLYEYGALGLETLDDIPIVHDHFFGSRRAKVDSRRGAKT